MLPALWNARISGFGVHLNFYYQKFRRATAAGIYFFEVHLEEIRTEAGGR
jgi:hypothetical protein